MRKKGPVMTGSFFLIKRTPLISFPGVFPDYLARRCRERRVRKRNFLEKCLDILKIPC
jgi:hypothetical protein